MQLALHSVSYAGVWPGQERLTLEEFIPRAAALGFKAVMLVAKRPHLSLLDYPSHRPEKRQALRALLAEHGLSVNSLAGYNDFTVGPERPDVPFWEHQIVYIAELASLARDLDCPAIRVFTGYERAGISYDAGWTSVVTGLREAARLAADFGVALTVQNHHDFAVDYESMYQLLSEVDHPNCRAAFDAWSPAVQGLHGEALAAAVRRMTPFMAYTTVADYVALPRYRYEPALVNYVAEPARMLGVAMGEGLMITRHSSTRSSRKATPARWPTRCAPPCETAATWKTWMPTRRNSRTTWRRLWRRQTPGLRRQSRGRCRRVSNSFLPTRVGKLVATPA